MATGDLILRERFLPDKLDRWHVVAFMAGRGKEIRDDRDGKLTGCVRQLAGMATSSGCLR